MQKGMLALTSLGLGAGIMYLIDPGRGKGRRARLRDAVVHTSHTLEAAGSTVSHDMGNRLAGAAARARTLLADTSAPGDDVLAARVRARIGRLVSHPGAIEVKATDGVIALAGPVFDAELEQLVNGVRAVPGVTRIENHLEPHTEATGISALQGRGPLTARGGWLRRLRRVPATRVMAGAAGLAIMAMSSRHRTRA